MEGFCLDIQRIILKQICTYDSEMRVSRLYNVIRVNHMFRKWAIRFVIENANRTHAFIRICQLYLFDHVSAKKWNMFGCLEKQWSGKKQSMLASFFMFIDTITLPVGMYRMPHRNEFGAAQKLFFTKTPIFNDLNKQRVAKRQLEIAKEKRSTHKSRLAHHKRLLERYEELAEKQGEKKQKAKKDLEKLDDKYIKNE